MFARDRREDGVPQGCCAARRPPQPLVPTRHRRHLHSTPTYLRATTPPARLDLTLLTARRYASSQTCAAIAQKICAGKCLSCGGMLHRTPIKPTHTVSTNRKIPADRYRVADQNSSASARRPDHPAANPIFYSSNRSTRARGSRPSWACWACLMRAPRPTCTSGPRRARPPAVYRQSSTIEPMLRCCLLASGMRFGGRAAEQYVASIIWLADPRASAGARGCRRRSGRLESCRLHDTRGHRHHVSVAADRPSRLPRAPAGASRSASSMVRDVGDLAAGLRPLGAVLAPSATPSSTRLVLALSIALVGYRCNCACCTRVSAFICASNVRSRCIFIAETLTTSNRPRTACQHSTPRATRDTPPTDSEHQNDDRSASLRASHEVFPAPTQPDTPV